MQPYPASPSAPPAPTETKRHRTRWMWPAIGMGTAAIVVLGIVFLRHKPEKNQDDFFPDLPEWFDRAHRIISAEQVTSVEGIGLLLPPPVEPLSQFSADWLENKFTHYVASNAFVWDSPKLRHPSDGKVLAGTKVISSGKQVREFTLVCAFTKDGRPVNFFMRTTFLRARWKGPPEIDDD